MYYRLVKGILKPAPKNIRELLGSPTRKQYLFFGYKPIEDTCPEYDGKVRYIDVDDVIKRVVEE
ncbi:MAG: hypothetical protein J6V93_01120 [Clostridia bacterium]|nr:hypothetical protein [Clostridia bacterium]